MGFSPRTVNQYLRVIRKADAWCVARGSSLAKAPADLVARYADTRPKTWSSRKELRAALEHYWTITKRKNPPLSVIRVPPKPAMVCRALDDEEALRLAKATDSHHDLRGFALALGLYQAMRREEIATVRWCDFARRGRRTWLTIVGKGDKQRTIPVHPKVVEKLAELERPNEWVFPGRFSTHVTPATIWKWVRELAEEVGIDAMTPHRLRHTCLATQNDVHQNLRATMHFAGHSRPETTAGYTRSTDDAVYDAMMSVDYLGERKRKPRRRPPEGWPWDQPTLFDGDEPEDDW